MTPRTAHIEYRKVWDGSGLNWWLFLTGEGHWCTIAPSLDASAKFTTKRAALIAGAVWHWFGIQPSRQTDEHRAKLFDKQARATLSVDALDTSEMRRVA
jgi:hypothetical protein